MSSNDIDDFTSFQKALVLIPKATGMLSMIGSGCIIYDIQKCPKRRRLVYHRLLLGMSLSDLVSSFLLFISSWSMPRGTDIFGASGTVATCTAHGFFAQAAATATPSYNTVLSIYYVLVVCRGLKEAQVKRLEIYLHSWPILLGVGTAIAGLPLTIYNPAGFHCWISSVPNDCGLDNDVPCERGENSWIFRWAFFYAWIWLYFVVIGVCIASVYYHVWHQERKTDRYNILTGQELDRRRSRRVAHQAFLYVGAYYLTFLFGTVARSIELANGNIPQPIYIFFVIFYPLQGSFNAMVYALPRYHRWRTDHPDESVIRFLWPSSRPVRRDSASFHGIRSSRSSLRKEQSSNGSSREYYPESSILVVLSEHYCRRPALPPNKGTLNIIKDHCDNADDLEHVDFEASLPNNRPDESSSHQIDCHIEEGVSKEDGDEFRSVKAARDSTGGRDEGGKDSAVETLTPTVSNSEELSANSDGMATILQLADITET